MDANVIKNFSQSYMLVAKLNEDDMRLSTWSAKKILRDAFDSMEQVVKAVNQDLSVCKVYDIGKNILSEDDVTRFIKAVKPLDTCNALLSYINTLFAKETEKYGDSAISSDTLDEQKHAVHALRSVEVDIVDKLSDYCIRNHNNDVPMFDEIHEVCTAIGDRCFKQFIEHEHSPDITMDDVVEKVSSAMAQISESLDLEEKALLTNSLFENSEFVDSIMGILSAELDGTEDDAEDDDRFVMLAFYSEDFDKLATMQDPNYTPAQRDTFPLNMSAILAKPECREAAIDIVRNTLKGTGKYSEALLMDIIASMENQQEKNALLPWNKDTIDSMDDETLRKVIQSGAVQSDVVQNTISTDGEKRKIGIYFTAEEFDILAKLQDPDYAPDGSMLDFNLNLAKLASDINTRSELRKVVYGSICREADIDPADDDVIANALADIVVEDMAKGAFNTASKEVVHDEDVMFADSIIEDYNEFHAMIDHEAERMDNDE